MYCLNDHSILFYSFIIISRPASSSFTFFRDVFTSTFSSPSVLCVSCLSKTVFRKIYLVCFWILCLIYSMLSWSGCHSWCFYRSNINVNERSSLPDVFCKKRVLRNFAKLARKYLCQRLFIKKRVLGIGVFLWILRNFKEDLFLQNKSGGCFCKIHFKIVIC